MAIKIIVKYLTVTDESTFIFRDEHTIFLATT